MDRYGVEVELVPGTTGAFEILADGKTVFSKHKTHRFPDDAEITSLLDD